MVYQNIISKEKIMKLTKYIKMVDKGKKPKNINEKEWIAPYEVLKPIYDGYEDEKRLNIEATKRTYFSLDSVPHYMFLLTLLVIGISNDEVFIVMFSRFALVVNIVIFSILPYWVGNKELKKYLSRYKEELELISKF